MSTVFIVVTLVEVHLHGGRGVRIADGDRTNYHVESAFHL